VDTYRGTIWKSVIRKLTHDVSMLCHKQKKSKIADKTNLRR
jgi:hypothetical protein